MVIAMPCDTLVFDAEKLSRTTALRGLLKGELAKEAGLSAGPIAAAFSGRRIGIRSARNIAKVLGASLTELVVSDAETVESTSVMAG